MAMTGSLIERPADYGHRFWWKTMDG